MVLNFLNFSTLSQFFIGKLLDKSLLLMGIECSFSSRPQFEEFSGLFFLLKTLVVGSQAGLSFVAATWLLWPTTSVKLLRA